MKITINKTQWEAMGKQAGWMKKADELDSTHPPQDTDAYTGKADGASGIDIFQFVHEWENEGYGIALISPDGKVVAPYIDPSDYPDMVLNKNDNGAKVISGKYKDYFIAFHSGSLEEKIGKDWVEDKRPDALENKKRLSFSFGTTPEEIIKEQVAEQTPSGYPMEIKSQDEWAAIAKAVNKGIDAHLEGFTRSKFDSQTGHCLIHPEEMHTFLRRLFEADDEESWGLRSAILETLGIEEI